MLWLQPHLDAQFGRYAVAHQELIHGHKRGCWMWYIFPQLRGLGTSMEADMYGIPTIEAAREYLGHEVLGPRLVSSFNILLGHRCELTSIFGLCVDIQKLHACATLFSLADDSENTVFAQAITRWFGIPHGQTVELLKEIEERHRAEVGE